MLRRQGLLASLVPIVLIAIFVACGEDDPPPAPGPSQVSDSGTGTSSGNPPFDSAAGSACDKLCTDAKFSGGTLTILGSGLAECQCIDTSTTGGLTKQACEAFCSSRGVPASKAAISSNDSENDKCVCDGTT